MKPVILILVGISGDLSKRKILPAIEKIATAGLLPDKFHVLGISRRQLQEKDVLEDLPISLLASFLSNHLQLHQMNLESADAYKALADKLEQIEHEFGEPAQRLFYLSVPPQTTQNIIRRLGESGLADVPRTRLLLEKPFGWDVESAEELIADTTHHFKEEQVYRIDHYLAKEMAQNMLIFRSGNSLIDRTWNKDFVDSIEIVISEKIGIEGRSVMYEQTGTLIDMVQSHLLQMAALTLMELPGSDDWNRVPELRLAALRQLIPPAGNMLRSKVLRGQYIGYKEEVGNPHSHIETFVALTLTSTDPRWEGVPIKLVTGKSLNQRAAEIHLNYRSQGRHETNRLVLRLNPPEGIELRLWSKRPGYERGLEDVKLDFTFAEQYDSLPEAHEQVILNAIRADHSLFTSSEEVLAAWQILAPIQQAWAKSAEDLVMYDAGSSAQQILSRAT